MKITAEEVERVAMLARLRLTTEEKSQLTRQLDDILEYVEKLNLLDTARVEPFTHALDETKSLREDAVTNQPNPEALLANAPAQEENCLKVRAVLEEA